MKAEELFARLNPPGRRRLRYRVGTYTTFLDHMLAALPSRAVDDNGTLARPLESLDPGSDQDFAAALVDAWATVGDVLTFYQERILNEGYVGTATESFSVQQLTAMLGFPLEPGVAAATWLAFNVSAAPGARTRLSLPAGTAAQSIPGQGETPQTFETASALTARPAWNALSPAPAYDTVAQSLAATDTQARLTGAGTGLTVGAPLLVTAPDASAWSFGAITTLEPNAQAGETRVVWAPAAAGTRGTGTIGDPAVLTFSRATPLFGASAAEWSSLTTDQKRGYREILGGAFLLPSPTGDWVGVNDGLPSVDLRAVLVDEAGRLWAGTAGRGVYVSTDAGLSWRQTGNTRAEIHSLSAGPRGRVYAGMAQGRVYRSMDGGASWDALVGVATLASTGSGKDVTVVNTRLPSSPVRAVFDDGEGTIYAGTDFGAYKTDDGATAWTALESSSSAHGSPPSTVRVPAVWCFARAPWGALVMGTDAGVMTVDGDAVGTGLPETAADGTASVVRALLADGHALLAGTDAGLYELTPGFIGRVLHHYGHWKCRPGPEEHGLPLAVRALADTPDGLLAATPAGVFREESPGVWTPVGTVDFVPDGGTAVGSPPYECGQPTPVPAPPGMNNPEVTALSAAGGRVLAATPFAGFPVEEWPAPPICDGAVYLDGTVAQAVPGSWLVLQQSADPGGDGPPAAVAVLRVVSARALTLDRYGRRGAATELIVEPAAGLDVFGMRTTTAYAAPRAFTLVRQQLPKLLPVSGTRLKLSGSVPAFPPGRAIAVNGSRIRAAVWPRASVFITGKKGWTAAGLASVDVGAAAWAPGGRALVAVGGEPGPAGPAAGLYASADCGATWTPAGGPLAGKTVTALASSPTAVWAAAKGDPKAEDAAARGAPVFTSADGVAWRAAGMAGRAVTALAVAADGSPYAATADAGVLRRGADGSWAAAAAGLPAGAVRAVACAPDGAVLAATATGVYRLAPDGAAWAAWTGLANHDVRALAVLATGEVLAGTGGGGVFSASAEGAAWAHASKGMTGAGTATVVSLAVTPAGAVYAGTRGGGCWTRAAGETAWTASPLGAVNDVVALAAGAAGVIAGCGAVPLLVDETGPSAALSLTPVLAADAAYAADLDRGAIPSGLAAAFTAANVTLSATAIARTQTAGSAWWIDDPSGVYLLRLDAGAVRARTPAGLATLMGPPPATSAGAAFADAAGVTATLTPRAGELLWQPAGAGAAAVGEVASVASASAAGLGATSVLLQSALANAYDPATVVVRGNVVRATQGATQGGWPRAEVLGSGNAGQRGQSFRLARSPLTFVPANTPTGSKSTLKVWVNGVEWTEVDALYGQPADAACYQVRVDQSGAATVVFGDGVYGARLPTGVGNVTAQYRVGIGPGGNLDAGRVTVLRNAPLGAKAVTNPVAADGGAVGQTTAEAALSAPLRSRTLQRVVALEDFRDFALAYPGISKAGARVVRDHHGRAVVVVTVAGGRGAPEQPDAGLLNDLARAMSGAGARGAFRVLAYQDAAFRAWARITVDPRRQADAVLATAQARLEAEYAFAARALAEGAAASHAVAVLQGVPGVDAVTLDAFHRSGASPSVQPYLAALPARVDAASGHLLAAQLLLPDATAGIVVRLAVAP